MGLKHNTELEFEEVVFGQKAVDRDYAELPLHRFAFWGIGIAAIGIVAGISGRLLWLNIKKGDFYLHRASANVTKEISLPTARGIITDRYGAPLVENKPVFTALLDIGTLLKKPVEDRMKLLQEIDLVLREHGIESNIATAIDESDVEDSSIIVIERGVGGDVAIALKDLNDEAIIVQNDYRRSYINGRVASHVLGYTAKNDRGAGIAGRSGLEEYYDRLLRGEDGSITVAQNARGKILDARITKSATVGATIETTLDGPLQQYVYDRMQEGLQALDRDAGVAIVLNTRTGDVLSLVSLPSFDGNVFTTSGKNDERQRFLTSRRKPLFNRAISGLYSPGSTIKPMMALGALHEGIVQPTDAFFSSGVLELPNPYDPEHPSKFLDWKAHGYVDMYRALAVSSNVYFYIVGGGFKEKVGLGIERIKAYWDRFRFWQKTGIDLPGESAGKLESQAEWESRTRRSWRVGNTYNTSIGQGDMLTTPLRLLSFIGSVGMRGVMQKPYLVREIKNTNGEIIERHESVVILDYTDLAKEIHEVRKGMRDAVAKEYGTAHRLDDLPMPVSGKTGSAQIENNKKTNAFFVGYAPSEDPEIALLILVEDAKEGSLNTIPIAHDILNWYYENRMKK